jgi:hypothetical protein
MADAVLFSGKISASSNVIRYGSASCLLVLESKGDPCAESNLI